jgi:5-methylcytosine-specific restriction endonuclease McrA
MVALELQVLVLNRLWQPVNTCTARRAVCLVFLGHAHIVHRDDENNYSMHDADSWIGFSREEPPCHSRGRLRSARNEFLVPEIIVLSIYDRLPKTEVKFTRNNVFLRDRLTCQYCATSFEPRELNLDHVIPRDKGGHTTWENVVTSCIRCNSKKANKLPHEARMVPLNPPRAPRWRPFHSSVKHNSPQPSWRDFIEVADGTVEISA